MAGNELATLVLKKLAELGLFPFEDDVEAKTEAARENIRNKGYKAEAIRCAVDGKGSGKDAFVFVNMRIKKGTRQSFIIHLQYGTFKPSLSDRFGEAGVGKSMDIDVSDELNKNYEPLEVVKPNDFPPVCNKQDSGVAENLRTLADFDKFEKSLRLVESINDHPYLQHKGIDIEAFAKERDLNLGAHVTRDGKWLAFKAFGAEGSVVGYGRVRNTRGEKGKFTKGIISRGPRTFCGGYSAIGFSLSQYKGEEVALAEGWASAIGYTLMTGKKAICAHGSKNCPPAIETISKVNEGIKKITFLSDGDDASEIEFAKCLKIANSLGITLTKLFFGKNTDAHDAWVQGISGAVESVAEAEEGVEQESEAQEEFVPYNIDTSKFPDVLRDYVEQGMRQYDIYPRRKNQYVMAVMSMISAVVGHCYYLGAGATRMYGNEWLIFTGGSGSGKSFAMDAGLAYLDYLDLENGRRRRLSMREERRLEKFIADSKKIFELATRKGALEIEVAKIQLDIEKKERELEDLVRKNAYLLRNRAHMVDGTLEGLQLLLSYRRGILYKCEEIDAWWPALQKKTASKDPAPFLVSLHKSASVSKHLVGGEPIDIAHPALSLCLAGVPEAITACFRENHIRSGFLSRFLYSYEPKSVKPIGFSAPKGFDPIKNHAAESALFSVWCKMIDEAFRTERVGEEAFISARTSEGHKCIMSSEAEAEADRFTKTFLAQELAKRPSDWADAVIERWKDHLAKIAMNICVLRTAHELERAPDRVVMTAEDVIAAEEVVKHSISCENFCVGLVMDKVCISKRTTVAEGAERVFVAISGLLKRTGRAVRRIVSKNAKLPGGAQDLNKAIELLVEQGRIEVYEDKGGQCFKLKKG